MGKIESKREKEKQIVEIMINIYCRSNHRSARSARSTRSACGVRGGEDTLCSECRELLEYAHLRSDKCPFMEEKTFCSNCKVHCYKPEMREKIRQVMKFSGPRMIFHHPIMAIRHVIETKKEKG